MRNFHLLEVVSHHNEPNFTWVKITCIRHVCRIQNKTYANLANLMFTSDPNLLAKIKRLNTCTVEPAMNSHPCEPGKVAF